jgi:nitrile hydratase alpha subunit
MPHDGHDHTHDDHAPIEGDEPHGYYQLLADAARELLMEKGYFGPDDMRGMIEKIDARTPALGARIVARAWVDPDFKARLLANGKKALEEEFGVDVVVADLVVVENTPEVHNTVVCTLCSCYPVFVLGRPPDWYKSAPYRSRVVREPRRVLEEFGTHIADGREIRVHDSTADMRYLVLPMRPEGTEGWTEEQLAAIVGRDSMVGTAEVTAKRH